VGKAGGRPDPSASVRCVLFTEQQRTDGQADGPPGGHPPAPGPGASPPAGLQPRDLVALFGGLEAVGAADASREPEVAAESQATEASVTSRFPLRAHRRAAGQERTARPPISADSLAAMDRAPASRPRARAAREDGRAGAYESRGSTSQRTPTT
jgi:hypothetical protein